VGRDGRSAGAAVRQSGLACFADIYRNKEVVP
jgi:hypothetical protein